MELVYRPRRLRSGETIRRMCRETRLSADSLIYPIFVDETLSGRRPIDSLPGQYHYGLDTVCEAVRECIDAGVKSCILFGIPAKKDALGSSAWDPEGVIQKAIRAIKSAYPDFYVVTDVCMCEYTDHGHCGALCGEQVDNDETLELLAKTALSHARAGADMVAPSDMMDGRVAAIRAALDGDGFTNVFREIRVGVLRPVSRRCRFGSLLWRSTRLPDGSAQPPRGEKGMCARRARGRGCDHGQARPVVSRHHPRVRGRV